jgi:hypothetical protein
MKLSILGLILFPDGFLSFIPCWMLMYYFAGFFKNLTLCMTKLRVLLALCFWYFTDNSNEIHAKLWILSSGQWACSNLCIICFIHKLCYIQLISLYNLYCLFSKGKIDVNFQPTFSLLVKHDKLLFTSIFVGMLDQFCFKV